VLGTVRVFRQKLTLEDAIGSHACSLEANMRVTNGIPLGSSLLLPACTVNCVQTRKGLGVLTLADVRARTAVDAIKVHDEIIYDVVWGKTAGGTPTVLTASADRTIRLFDVHRKMLTTEFVGHRGSVKTISTDLRHPSLVLSGGRDGAVMLWDTRVQPSSSKQGDSLGNMQGKAKSGQWHTPVLELANAHRRANRAVHSITAVALLGDGNTALSGGADGNLSRWDLRASTTRGKRTVAATHAARGHGCSSSTVSVPLQCVSMQGG
jgi:WD40 repeat protein